jgi:hypothetical protein
MRDPRLMLGLWLVLLEAATIGTTSALSLMSERAAI